MYIFTYSDSHNPAQPGDWGVDVIYYLVVLAVGEGVVCTECALGTPHTVDTDKTSSIHKTIVERCYPSGIMYCWAVIKVSKQDADHVGVLFNEFQQMVNFVKLLLLSVGVQLRTG